MKIYEIGSSVKARVLQLPAGEFKTDEFLCVLDNVNVSVERGLQHMIAQLPQKEVEHVDHSTATITYKDGNKYTLATEKIIENKDTTVIKVSNLLRYIYSRDFSIDMLYYNQEEGVVDLSGNAVEDVLNRVIRTVVAFPKLIAADNTVLLKALEYRVCDGFRFSNEIDELLHGRLSYVKPLDGKYDIINRMVRTFNSARQFFYTLERYPHLEHYLAESSQASWEFTFSATPKAKEAFEQSNVFNVKRNKNKEQPDMPGLRPMTYKSVEKIYGKLKGYKPKPGGEMNTFRKGNIFINEGSGDDVTVNAPITGKFTEGIDNIPHSIYSQLNEESKQRWGYVTSSASSLTNKADIDENK